MNGYPPHIIRRGILEGKATIHTFSRTTSSEISNSNLKLIYFTMSYYGQESLIVTSRIREICRKLLPQLQIHFAFKKNLSLK